LRKVIHGNQLDPKDIPTFLQHLIKSLEYLAQINVTHSDLKPANILCSIEHGNIKFKLADFGLSKLIGIDSVWDNSSITYSKNRLKKEVDHTCTRWYRAPEIEMRFRNFEKIDMWSFGCIIIEMIIKMPLFEGAEGCGVFSRPCLANLHGENLLEAHHRIIPQIQDNTHPFFDILHENQYIDRKTKSIIVTLVKNCLVIDLDKRWSARDALRFIESNIS